MIQDIRFGIRLLRRSPFFTMVAVASLALGMGAGLGLFAFMNALLFRPLPGRDTADIQRIYTSNHSGGRYGSSSFADIASWMASAPEVFAGVCATTNVKANLALDQTYATSGALVSSGCSETLRIRPQLGRLLARGDDEATGDAAPIVISHAFWRRVLASNPDVVGRSVLINGATAVIVGVAEPGFSGLSLDAGAEFWAPLQLATVLASRDTLTARGARQFQVFVRLADGVTAAQAEARLAGIAEQLRAEAPQAWTDAKGATRRITVVRELDARFVGNAGAATEIATMMIAAIAGVVALACVNLATITLARGAARTREINLRLALGASRGRLLRQLATESLLISAAGCAAGAALLLLGVQVFNAYRPAEVPAFNIGFDLRVVAVAMALAVFAPVLFGVAPGASALRLAIAEGLKGRVVARRRFLPVGARELLLVTQIVVSFALLIMSSLFMRSLTTTTRGPAEELARATVAVPIDLNTAAASEDERLLLGSRVLDAVNRVPGVRRVTAAGVVPLTGSNIGFPIRLPERPDDADSSTGNVVAPQYLELTGVALRAGRTFDAGDHARAPKVAVVSEALARRLWNSTAVVGRSLRVNDVNREVVGVVADVPYRQAKIPNEPLLYVPLAQTAATRFIVHAETADLAAVAPAIDRALRSVDARIIVGSVAPLSALLDLARVEARVTEWIGGGAGLVQLALVLMALWGLVAFAVERRTPEIAIRRALGASERGIVALVMRPSLWLLGIGAMLGISAGVAAAAVLHAEFTGLAPLDFIVIAPVAGVFGIVVVVAAWLPARRAAAIQPAAALKQT